MYNTESYLKTTCLAKSLVCWDSNATTRNKFYLENWFLSLPRLVYYFQIYRISNNSKRSEERFRIFLLASRLSGRRWRKERRHPRDAIIRNIRMFFPKSSREWRLYEEVMKKRRKKGMRSRWIHMPTLCNILSSVIITCPTSTHKDKQNNKAS